MFSRITISVSYLVWCGMVWYGMVWQAYCCCCCYHHYYGYCILHSLTHSTTNSNTVDGRAGLRMRWKHLRIQLLSLQCARRTDSGDPSHRSCRSGSRSRGPPSPCCSVRNVPCDKRYLRGDNLSISDRIYLSTRGRRMTSTPTARRERRPCRSRNQVRSEVQPLPCHRMVPWVEFESLGGNNGSPPRDRPRCDAMRCDAMQILAPLFQVVVLAA